MKTFPFNPAWAMDPRIRSLSESQRSRHVMILCYHAVDSLAGLREVDLAAALGITPDELAETKTAFLDRGLILDDWTPSGSFAVPDDDPVMRSRRLNAERQKRYREGRKGSNGVTQAVTSNVTRNVTRNVHGVTKSDPGDPVTLRVTLPERYENVTRNASNVTGVTGVTSPPHTPLINTKTPSLSFSEKKEREREPRNVTPSVTQEDDDAPENAWKHHPIQCSPEEIKFITAKVGELFDPLGATDAWFRNAMLWVNYYPAVMIEATLWKIAAKLPTQRRIGEGFARAILEGYVEDKGVPEKDLPPWRRAAVEIVSGGVIPSAEKTGGKPPSDHKKRINRYSQIAFGDEEEVPNGGQA